MASVISLFSKKWQKPGIKLGAILKYAKICYISDFLLYIFLYFSIPTPTFSFMKCQPFIIQNWEVIEPILETRNIGKNNIFDPGLPTLPIILIVHTAVIGCYIVCIVFLKIKLIVSVAMIYYIQGRTGDYQITCVQVWCSMDKMRGKYGGISFYL